MSEYDDMMNSCADSVASAFQSELERLVEENKQLKEALMKCTPFDVTVPQEAPCLFCKKITHDEDGDDCEYVRLTNDVQKI